MSSIKSTLSLSIFVYRIENRPQPLCNCICKVLLAEILYPGMGKDLYTYNYNMYMYIYIYNMYICTNPTGYIAIIKFLPRSTYRCSIRMGWTIVVLADVAPWRCGWSSGFLQHPSTNGWWSRDFKVGGWDFPKKMEDCSKAKLLYLRGVIFFGFDRVEKPSSCHFEDLIGLKNQSLVI